MKKLPAGSSITVHLCAPRRDKCPAYSDKLDVFHLAPDRWKVEQEANVDGPGGAAAAAAADGAAPQGALLPGARLKQDAVDAFLRSDVSTESEKPK